MAETLPLQAVKVFDAVARHMNFTKAAEELNMTQSAVSYQVKLLEDFIGTALFRREARGVALSEHGRAVAPLVRQALGDLTQAFRSAKAETANLLVISTLHTFATNWLAPRLGSFQSRGDYRFRLQDLTPATCRRNRPNSTTSSFAGTPDLGGNDCFS